MNAPVGHTLGQIEGLVALIAMIVALLVIQAVLLRVRRRRAAHVRLMAVIHKHKTVEWGSQRDFVAAVEAYEQRHLSR